MRRRFVLLFMLLLASLAQADIFHPAYLQLKQLDAETYDVMWKIPALDEQTTLKARPVFPAVAREVGQRTSTYATGSAVQRWRVGVPGGLEGKPIRFDGLSLSGFEVLVRVERNDGTEQLARLLPTAGGPTQDAADALAVAITHAHSRKARALRQVA